jgi:hypothetical protein
MQTTLDVDDWRTHASAVGFAPPADALLRWCVMCVCCVDGVGLCALWCRFWEVVGELSKRDKQVSVARHDARALTPRIQLLLTFVTGSPHVPAGGFARLGGAHGLQVRRGA